jgi:hypothetical protein
MADANGCNLATKGFIKMTDSNFPHTFHFLTASLSHPFTALRFHPFTASPP